MKKNHFDVIIIGGGIIGSSVAYFLAREDRFPGSILVLEKDPTYAHSSTALSVGGIRQQFSTQENIQISQFGAAFLKSVKQHLAVRDEAPDISFQENGYLFLATKKGLPILQQNFQLQKSLGVDVMLLNPSELKYRYSWLDVADLAAGSLGLTNEGWFDPYSLLMALQRKARSLGAQYRSDEAIGIVMQEKRTRGVRLANGETLWFDYVVNAAGPRAEEIATMAGIADLPVRPRKRFVYTFQCRTRLSDCPLVIDPSGVYFRPEGETFICGVSPPGKLDPDCLDFDMDYRLFDEVIWPALAYRVPAFESIKRGRSWAGHYAYNIIDQNAILGFHPEIKNFIFANGFSGHGLQQAPAVGRAISELITFGSYQTLDLGKFSFDRFATGKLVKELNVV